jgi:type IV pilus assembly protein PilO
MAIDTKSFQKLKWHTQLLVVAGVCAALLALVWYQFLSPMQEEITAKEGRLVELQALIQKSVAQQKVLAQLKKESLELQAQLDSLKSVLPLERETARVLVSVQDAARNSALRINRFAFRPVIDHEVYTEWPIEMEVVGTYHNIGAFLDRIRTMSRIVNISALKIQSRASTGAAAFTSSVGATYTATTFVYREEPPDGAPPAATTVK